MSAITNISFTRTDATTQGLIDVDVTYTDLSTVKRQYKPGDFQYCQYPKPNTFEMLLNQDRYNGNISGIVSVNGTGAADITAMQAAITIVFLP